MNKRILFIAFLFACRVGFAQNLVPNGDFEQFSGCPSNISQLDSALNWFNPFNSTSLGSPDYFNECAYPLPAGIPYNTFGFQYARSGFGYAGVYQFLTGGGSYREYAEVELISPLIAGACYYFEMYISLGEWCRYRASNIGVYFTDTIINNLALPTLLPYTPQINNISGNLPDTATWTLVSGTYTAGGGENFLIIGNFQNDLLTDTTLYNGAGVQNRSYVYIDDICLTNCGASCLTSSDEQNAVHEIKVYPIPASDNLYFQSRDYELSEFIIYDITSRKLLQEKFSNFGWLNIEHLVSGIYLYEVRNKSGVIKKGKVVKE